MRALFGEEAEVVRTFPGRELVGARYERPFDWVEAPEPARERAWQVVEADFVSAEDGTGIVHIAPAFGADDYAVGQAFGLPVLQPVDDRGQFLESIPLVGGEFVKDADDKLLRALKEAGRVFRFGREEHSYPHCWRCGSPLLYMARDSWFIRTTQVRDELLRNNDRVNWYPPEVGAGRFGEWLENNVDWALSRMRFWGTPLPAWVCDGDSDHVEFIGSFEELQQRTGPLPEPFDPHRPFIDEYSWACRVPGCQGTMRRTPEVIDVWYDSGAMPFARWHYPFENREAAERLFPAHFICEGVDQTRGGFYSLMAISTLLGRGPAYRNVIVNDMVLDAEGQKMSKSRGNVVDPWVALNDFGADAIRWYLLSSSHPWLPKRFDAVGVREVQRKVFDTLRSSYHFFSLYAAALPEQPIDPASRPLIDRWILGRLDATVAAVRHGYENYDVTSALRALVQFAVDDLSNWYVRQTRDRFWAADGEADGAAVATLHECLRVTAVMLAPAAPFVADWLHRALTGSSVHLADFPHDAGRLDPARDRAMDAVRRLASMGRAAREEAGIRVRQPLARMQVAVPGGVRGPEFDALLDLLRSETNVKQIEVVGSDAELVRLRGKANFRSLGKRYGAAVKEVAAWVTTLEPELLRALERGEAVNDQYQLLPEDVTVVRDVVTSWPVASDGPFVAALDPEIGADLALEGLARALGSRIQRLRKDAGYQVSERIALAIEGDATIAAAALRHSEWIAGETLAESLVIAEPLEDADRRETTTIDQHDVALAVRRHGKGRTHSGPTEAGAT